MPEKTNYKEHDCECSDVCNFISSFQLFFSCLLLVDELVLLHVCQFHELTLNNKIKYFFFLKRFLLIVSSHSAFCKADHAPRLDHFFCLFFQQLIQPSRLREGSSSAPPPDISGTLFLDGLPAVRWLTLPPEIKVHCWICECKVSSIFLFLHVAIAC